MSAERYEISECELDVLAITGPEGTYYIDGENIEARAIRQQARDIDDLQRVVRDQRWKFGTVCDANEMLASEREQLRADLAAAVTRTSSLERTIATLQMRLRRAGQLLMEEIGAGGPENADDTAERAACVILNQAGAIAALSSQLGNLLAVIHRDGGHYESEYGTEKACADAMQRICDTRARLGAADELAMLVRRLARALQKAAPDSDLPKTAMDYLSIAGLAGSPMRRDE